MISHVAQIQMNDIDDPKLKLMRETIVKSLAEHGYMEDVHYSFKSGRVDEEISWPVESSDVPSSSQVGFLKMLYKDLQKLAHNCLRPLDVERCKELLNIIKTDMQDPNITKKRVSAFINTTKDAISEMEFKRSGVRTNEWS